MFIAFLFDSSEHADFNKSIKSSSTQDGTQSSSK